jgi:transposase
MAELVRARRLTDQAGQRLQQIVRRGKHESVRVRRAMIIMASASGTLVPAIARLVAADEDTVRDVIHAFNAKGLAALDLQWAGGRPRLISDEDVEVIVTAARTRPEKLGRPFTRWSLRKLHPTTPPALQIECGRITAACQHPVNVCGQRTSQRMSPPAS